MKTSLLALPLFAAVFTAACAQTSNKAPQPPPPVIMGRASDQPQPVADGQRVYGNGGASDLFVPPEVLNGVLDKFRSVYGAANGPRIVIYVNRELVDTSADLKLTGHTEKYEKTNDTLKTSGKNTYGSGTASTPTLADKQTVRDIERLFGRVFRNGGARLADQKIAVDMLAEKPDQRLLGDHASKQREALASVADIAIEVLISSRNLTLPGISGDQSIAVPDIQATAIRLKDAAIVGQASASELLGKASGPSLRSAGTPEVTEATAIALMQDMLVSPTQAAVPAP